MQGICLGVFVHLELMKSAFILFVYNFSKSLLFWGLHHIFLAHSSVAEFNETYILL